MADAITPKHASPGSSRRRRRPVLGTVAALVLLGGAAAGSWATARAVADVVEQRSAREVREALEAGGFDWATVATDGLQVLLGGTAPDEVQRFRALAQAGTAVDAGRLRDQTTVRPPDQAAAPDFRIELLSNDHGISIIGLAPASIDRADVIARLERAARHGRVTDLLETADHPAPDNWDEALDFALDAAAQTRQGKLSIRAGRLDVTAITDGPAEKTRLESALARTKPDGVALVLDVRAPRPVISPFALRLTKDPRGMRFDTCSADSRTARDRILRAAAAAGVPEGAECVLGLGAPTPEWADAVVPGIEALAALPAGTLTFSDASVSLDAPLGVPAAAFDEAVGRLEQALPEVFSLTATLETAPTAAAVPGPVEFVARVTDDGLRLRGRITDERMREAVESFARARFGTVDSTLRVDESVPAGWTVRVIAALEAMAQLRDGSATVTPDLVRLAGISGNRNAADQAAQRLGARLGAGARYELSIAYDERLDPSLGLPTGEECVAALNAVMQSSEIGFEPNRAVITGDPQPVLAKLAETMQNCAEFPIEIGGHTDSQGSESFNQELSQDRAEAVLAALRKAGVPAARLSARGYGESRPIASNDTAIGREANRRIEFALLPHPAPAPPPPAETVTGTTVEVEALPQTEARAQDTTGQVPAPAEPGTTDAEPAQAAPATTPGAAATITTRRPDDAPTADELAAREGLSIRPLTIEATGDRLTTPIPPPLAGATGLDGSGGLGGPRDGEDDDRPSPRPEQPPEP